MKQLTIENLLSITGGKKESKECKKLRQEIISNWEMWDSTTKDSKAQEWIDKCSD